MKTLDDTVSLFRRLSTMTLGAALIIAGGGRHIAAQVPRSPGPDTVALADANVLNGYHRITLAEYGDRILGPRALARDLATAGFGQMTRRPTEWSRSWDGYGKRVSSRLVSDAIAQTIVAGASAIRDERPAHFTVCHCGGTTARVGHALLTPLLMETPRGEHRSLLVPASEIGSAILVTSLHPGGFSLKGGLASGTVGIAVSALGAVAREFWPSRWRPFGI
jgi:hypothetical protein